MALGGDILQENAANYLFAPCQYSLFIRVAVSFLEFDNYFCQQ